MKKLSTILCTLALLFGVVGGVNSVKAEKIFANPSNGTQTWTPETHTFTWTAVSNAFINLGLPIGDISAYTLIHFNVESISNAPNFRLIIKNGGKNDQLSVTLTTGETSVYLANYSSFDFSCVTSIELFSNASWDMGGFTIDGDNPASAVITDIYMEKPTKLVFDDFGKAVINKTALTATGGLSYDSSSGILSSNGESGELIMELAEPVDLRNLFQFNVTRTGTDNIVDCLRLYDEDNTLINTWNGIKWSNSWNPSGLDDNATNAFLSHKPVKKLVWQSDAGASKNGMTLTITSVEFTLKTVSCAKAGETQLKTLPWININTGNAETPDWNMNGSSDTYYGNYSGDPDHYVDITDYEELRVYCKDNNTGFRAFFIISDGSTTNIYNTSKATWNNEEKYYSLDLSKVADKWNGKIALKAMKAGQSWNGDPAEKNVTNIVVYKKPTVNVQYILSGSGMLLPEAVAALADASATCIDAMGVKGITTNSEAGRTLLTSANPNCLFLGSVGNGKLSNTKNVIDGDACANLELVDGKPFKAPTAFTATAAKFTKAVGNAAYATMVVPFAVASLPTGVKAYNLNAANGEVITTEEVTSLTADKPVLVKAAADTYEFTASNVAVAATPDDVVVNGLLRGVYATTSAAADASNYVMQKNGNDVNFYLVTGTDATVKPFRAYLTTAVPSARMLTFNLDEATAIDAVNDSKKTSDGYYNLNGQRVAQPTKGLYIINGKKHIVR